MFKLNEICENCLIPYKIIWNCKKSIDDKDWIYLCGNCVRYSQYLNGRKFKSQLQNIKSIIRCRINLSKLELPLYIVS